MCLGIPSKIIKIEDSKAVVDVYGAQREISLLVLDEPVDIGDYVIVHAGFAIQKLREDVAIETLGYFNEYLRAMENVEDSVEYSPKKKTRRAKKRAK